MADWMAETVRVLAVVCGGVILGLGCQGSGRAALPQRAGQARNSTAELQSDRPGEAGPDAPADTGKAGFPPVAIVAGHALSSKELLKAWLHQDSPGVRALLDELILSRLVHLEAERLGLALSADDATQAREAAWRRLEEEIERSASGLGTDEFLEARLGLDPLRYRERLGHEAVIDRLAERVVRGWLLTQEHALVRMIVVSGPEKLAQVQAGLAAGESFASLASEFSEEGSAQAGGRVPPVVRGDSPLAQLAFTTQVGEVGGPVPQAGRWLIVKVDQRPAPLGRGGTPEGAERFTADILASLAQRPIEDPEYWQWKSAVTRRYEVDMAPLFGIMGDVLAREPRGF